LREAVIRRAAEHGISLGPDQILVQRSGTAENPKFFLVAKYPGTGGNAGNLADLASEGGKPVAAVKPFGEQRRCPGCESAKAKLLDRSSLPGLLSDSLPGHRTGDNKRIQPVRHNQ
jgi:hypothetical protein